MTTEYKKKNIKKVTNRRPSKKSTAPRRSARPSPEIIPAEKPVTPAEEVVMKSVKHRKPTVPKRQKASKEPKRKNDRTSRPVTESRERKSAPFRVINGSVNAKNKKRTAAFYVLCVLLALIVVFSALTPTGPLEYIENKVNSMGNGSFPVSISGSEMLNAFSVGSLTYVLTDTHAEVYNGSGKQLFSRQHSFNSPSMRVSSQRAIVYDQGGRELHLFSCSDVIRTMTFDYQIYCADISRNGTVAVATKSKGYASQVEVFSKNGISKYVWYCADEIVNNVVLSDNGKRLAVSTVSVSGGVYVSKLYIFIYNSADPITSLTYEGTIIYSLEPVSSSHFAVVTDGSVDYIKWRGGTKFENKNKYTLNIFRYKRGSWNAAVTGNKSGSTVTVRTANGKTLNEFDFNGAVSDISVAGNNVFILSDGYLYILDKRGNPTAEKYNMSSYSRIFAHNPSTVISAGNFGLDKYKN